MKKSQIVLLFLVVGIVGLLSCGQIPDQQPAPLAPGAGSSAQGASLAKVPKAPDLAPPPGEILLQDNFNGNNNVLDQVWSVLDTAHTPGEQAYWYSSDGLLVQGGTTLDSDSVDPAFLITNVGTDWTDYIVRVNAYVTTNDEVGLIFRVNDRGFYRFRLRSDQFTGPYQAVVDRFEDGKLTFLWSDTQGGFPAQKWITLQVAVKGDTFIVSVDGKALTTVQDSAFATGGVGFFAWSEKGAYFDNIVVTR